MGLVKCNHNKGLAGTVLTFLQVVCTRIAAQFVFTIVMTFIKTLFIITNTHCWLNLQLDDLQDIIDIFWWENRWTELGQAQPQLVSMRLICCLSVVYLMAISDAHLFLWCLSFDMFFLASSNSEGEHWRKRKNYVQIKHKDLLIQ